MVAPATIHEDLRSLGGKLPNVIWKDGLVTDEQAELCAARVQWYARPASLKFSNLFRQASSEREKTRKGQIFSERNEMNFVIARSPLAIWINERS